MTPVKAKRWIVVFFILMLVSFSNMNALASTSPFSTVFFLTAFIFSVVGLITMLTTLKALKNNAGTSSQSRQDKPAAPAPKKARRRAKPAREYQAMLAQLQADCQSIEESERLVHQLIDDYFGGSYISSSKYKNVLEDAGRVLKKNYDNARQAVDLFGSSKPTPQRLAILQNYVHDSQDIVDNVNKVVDELLKARQDSTLRDGTALDESLEELVSTTVYYTRKEN